MFKKVIVSLLALCASHVVAMEQQAKKVQGVVIQVEPGYITGSSLWPSKLPEQLAAHTTVLTGLSASFELSTLTPVKELELYYILFKRRAVFERVAQEYAQLPGFQAVYDAAEYHENQQTLRRSIFAMRLKQLEALRVAKELDELMGQTITIFGKKVVLQAQ